MECLTHDWKSRVCSTKAIKPCTVEEFLGAVTARLDKQTVLKQWCAAECETTQSFQPTEPAFSQKEHPGAHSASSIFPVCSKLNQVFQFIEDNYQQPINLYDVAQAVGYSPGYLTSLVKRRTKLTVHCWIVERRMAEARSLLLKTDQPVHQIAASVGYSDVGHFIRQFRQLYDLPPRVWRNTHCTQPGIQ